MKCDKMPELTPLQHSIKTTRDRAKFVRMANRLHIAVLQANHAARTETGAIADKFQSEHREAQRDTAVRIAHDCRGNADELLANFREII